ARLDQLREELNISDFESESGYVNRNIDIDSMQKLEMQRLDAEVEYAGLLNLYRELTNCTPAELRRTAATASPDPILADLLQGLSKDERTLAGMTNAFSPEHPEVLAIRGAIATINKQIEDRLQGIVAGVKIKMESQKANRDLRALAIEQAKSNDIYQTKLRRPYNVLKRDLETAKFVREQLHKRVWQEKVEQVMPRTAIVQIVDKAEPEPVPVKPKKMLNVVLGVIVGLAIGIGLAFFIEYLDTSVKTIDDVERALQAPVLG